MLMTATPANNSSSGCVTSPKVRPAWRHRAERGSPTSSALRCVFLAWLRRWRYTGGGTGGGRSLSLADGFDLCPHGELRSDIRGDKVNGEIKRWPWEKIWINSVSTGTGLRSSAH